MPTETMKTKKYALLYGRKKYGRTEKVPAFADSVSKAIFLTEKKRLLDMSMARMLDIKEARVLDMNMRIKKQQKY